MWQVVDFKEVEKPRAGRRPDVQVACLLDLLPQLESGSLVTTTAASGNGAARKMMQIREAGVKIEKALCPFP
ncbi:hypothetical protein HNQ08_004509 [Deinococcus humi]|uniref:Uncharacterized protein n=1 Tax=Deinococcus humi TaxID=662880 RepID=A0A7W8K0K3_9DEIO|nr:hypothetical protein [Deinococcus humi]MBB5365388.1 hypothetical protein [Deinococcus humi]